MAVSPYSGSFACCPHDTSPTFFGSMLGPLIFENSCTSIKGLIPLFDGTHGLKVAGWSWLFGSVDVLGLQRAQSRSYVYTIGPKSGMFDMFESQSCSTILLCVPL